MSMRTSAAAAVVLVTSVVVAMAPAPARADSPSVSSESPPFSITLQGAASLGTYEAALTWTLIRLIRAQRLSGDPQRTRLSLEALSGSSAGSVNALLSAALWCEAEDEVGDQSVDRNLLRDSWLAVGLDELLPGDPGLYTRGDGLFASSAFAPSWRASRAVSSPRRESGSGPDAGSPSASPRPGSFRS